MTIRAAEVACDSVWRAYLLLHEDVNEDDDRRITLDRYITHLCEYGERDPDALQSAGLMYLRKLDQLGEEWDRRLAQRRALDEAFARGTSSRNR